MKMGCTQKENSKMWLYFIVEPDGQHIEILPAKDRD
jgi:lactoylglutathione lyase